MDNVVVAGPAVRQLEQYSTFWCDNTHETMINRPQRFPYSQKINEIKFSFDYFYYLHESAIDRCVRFGLEESRNLTVRHLPPRWNRRCIPGALRGLPGAAAYERAAVIGPLYGVPRNLGRTNQVANELIFAPAKITCVIFFRPFARPFKLRRTRWLMAKLGVFI